GNWSSIGGNVENICIYTSVVIENAIGGSGNDNITGNNAANRLDGGLGSDTLIGGAGGDALNGGDCIDTATYRVSRALVNVFLNAPQINNGGEAAGDTFDSIENLIGSQFGDILSAQTNVSGVMRGLGGDDYLSGSSVSDTLFGGFGNDILNGFGGA